VTPTTHVRAWCPTKPHQNPRRFPPEPWNGHLGEAKILFLSSNPSAATPEVEPKPFDITAESPKDELVAQFDGAFDDGLPYIQDGIRWVDVNNTTHQSVRFWASVRARAQEILERRPVPGVDYVVTEVVHCGSRDEHEVDGALSQCVDLYLERVLVASGARVVVVLGSHAASALRPAVPADPEFGLVGAIRLGGRERMVIKLPHPNRIGPPKTIAAHASTDAMTGLRAILATD
jgi:hypothetical protein